MTDTSITQASGAEPATPCREVAGWVNPDGTRGFRMRCGDAYDNIDKADLASMRAAHVCGSETEAGPSAQTVEMTERAADAIADLMLADAKLRGLVPDDEADRPRWPQLQHGERVTLTIDATVVHDLDADTATFRLDLPGVGEPEGGRPSYLYLRRHHPHVRIDRASPADGEPEPGELWTDQAGQVYLVQQWASPCLAGVSEQLPKPWREVHTGPAGPIRRLMSVDEIARYQ